MSKIYVVTGANRGIGLRLVQNLAKKDGIVVATVRSKAKVAGTPLTSIDNVRIVELEAESQASLDAAAAEIALIAPTGIDELWNNVGVYNVNNSPISMTTVGYEGYQRDLTVNVVAPIYFTSKLLPLLEKRDTKKVVFISSIAGSLSASIQMESILSELEIPYNYASTKTALNMAVFYLHKEFKSKGFAFIPIHPGLVATDMYHGKDNFGDPISPEESAKSLISTVEKIDPKHYSFSLTNYDGTILPW
ncbi:hypothetical protein POJ06DRAFT_283104 [Lipomyces tetrasporus]|uniref:Uncharacterized protein n=1 Tax=Lipomyces tetrasporus TaxID=54092 RepID=A0AAD7QM02_9ASCO|nr:uncharacterized protein POJ06DRAFT_283104 [Lipomyces tetrasporus]KAJ8097699.1 hypothetical protein POJ06DRAFT_283104 [Lipomyces tetrasporus]